MSTYCLVRTSLGTLALGYTPHGLSRIVLPSDWSTPAKLDLARAGFQEEQKPPRAIARIAQQLTAHIDGKPQDFRDVPLDSEGVPDFLLRVQRAAQAIPPGKTRTYAELAAMAGAPSAARAVGRAMATNRWPIIVPCHRVFSRTGFGEYSAGSGVQTKLRLLWREGYRGRTSNVPFDELEALEHLARDPALARLIRSAGPFTLQATAPKVRGAAEPFAILADAIISQQLSSKAAATIYARVAALFGGDEISDPARVLETPKEQLRAAGLSESKALSLLDLARRAAADELPSRSEMERLSDQEIIERLVPIRGIGRWSVQMLLMFYLGRPDVLPVDDLGVQKGFALTYGKRGLPSRRMLERTARAWSPYASVASWFMWRAVDLSRYQRP